LVNSPAAILQGATARLLLTDPAELIYMFKQSFYRPRIVFGTMSDRADTRKDSAQEKYMKSNQPLSPLRSAVISLATLALAFVAGPAYGASVIDPTGASYTQVFASSSYNGSYGPSNLFNFNVTGVTPGSTLADSQEWATAGQMSAYVAFQLPTTHTVTSLFFAQRDSGGRPDTDQMNLASIWVSTSAPFDPNSPPGTTPNAFLVLNDSGNPVWTEYPLTNSLAGRYFLVQFVKTNGTCCNPGGRELRLGEVATVSGEVLSDSPLAYYHFNESPGATVAVDSMGNFDATYGATSVLGGVGPRSPTFPGFPADNTAVGTTGGDSTSEVTVPALNLNTNTMTIVMWINPTGQQDPYATLLGWRDGNNADFGMLAYGGQLGWVWENAGWPEQSGLTIPSDQWSMAAMVITPTNAMLYLGANGTLGKYTSPNSNSVAAFDTPLTIGGEPNGSRVLNGLIDDVAIFSHSLSADQIQAIYAAGVGQVPVTITQQPVSRTNYAGGTARFSVVVSGSATGFQWMKGTAPLVDGGRISGANTPTLAIASLTAADGTNYSCVVSKALGTLSSNPATLTVIPAPTTGFDAAVLAYNPLAYWQLNEAPGTTRTVDYWGSFDGTPLPDAVFGVNGPRSPDLPGFTSGNTALQTAAGDGNSSVAVPALNLNTNTATVLMWIYPNGAQSFYTSMFANRSGGYLALNYLDDGATLSFQWNSYGWNSGLLVPSNQWSLIGMVITPTDATVYLGTGGALSNSTEVIDNPVMSFAGTSYIGSDSGNDTRVFNGTIDDVAFFNRSLSATEIARMYNVALGLVPPPTALTWTMTASGLVLTWSSPWTLQQADAVTGPWGPATGVTSGVPIPTTAAKRFYRLKF
jgi:concanavalin A-like lectin/glucanase superfamily protein/immunoglobulin I-set domain protein